MTILINKCCCIRSEYLTINKCSNTQTLTSTRVWYAEFLITYNTSSTTQWQAEDVKWWNMKDMASKEVSQKYHFETWHT